ncbi:malonyl-ACP O-methyltransferase BioC [Dokdonella fugitiva]|uniref:Malonyl-[acyl-carrier protein] O-methyltransferase n=1 Tax=Dokdonella fugitiva TaxID=328517 RepID=A0A4R2IGL9_9GAMM|nr:malonyl-ACP O-methyltransferase BioC [Dokdonella fugitiva]TCO43366.1 malonyl-CoA O-methyltransferase [Dokdonella fugitiva]
MSAGLDRAHIRRAFGRAAASYAAHSPLQAEVALRLREHLDEVAGFAPRRIVDVGCGPGEGCVALRARFPDADIIALDLALPMLREVDRSFPRVGADAQALPLADASVDLVHSSLCLQWCDDPGLALAEFRRVLRPEGLLLFSTFGPDTLKELRAAFAEVDRTPHVSRFVDMHDIGDGLLASGFRDPVMEREDFVLTYANLRGLMRELRAIGATNADVQRQRTLTGKAHLARVEAAYEPFRADGVLPATYEVVYAIARAPAPGQPRRESGGDIASFPIERLRGSRRR